VKLSNIFATICIGKFAVPMFLSIDPFAGISIAISIRIRSTTSCKREREREQANNKGISTNMMVMMMVLVVLVVQPIAMAKCINIHAMTKRIQALALIDIFVAIRDTRNTGALIVDKVTIIHEHIRCIGSVLLDAIGQCRCIGSKLDDALSMSIVLVPIAFEHIAIGPSKRSMSMSTIVAPLAFVHIAGGPSEAAIAMALIVTPLAFIHDARRGVLHSATALLDSCNERSGEVVAVIECQ
jgi:hypothetical protein